MKMKPSLVPTRAFTLVEILTVISIMAIMIAVSGPAIRGLTGANTINKAASDISQTLELTRSQAMAGRTPIRAAIGELPPAPGRITPSTVVLILRPADGSLEADTPADMANAAKWPLLFKPLVLENLVVRDDLNATDPDTAADANPADSDIGAFTRTVPGLADVKFTTFIQFDPSGEVRVRKGEAVRHIKLALDRPAPQDDKNPFLLRLSGINGTVRVLRKENL